jgi:imidazoleglycerol phosphate synthase glutamine amidotransferase subunit HisH
VNNDEVLARTPFGSTSFVSGVLSKNILGVQFHPEKSGGKGKSLISEIVQWARSED